MNNLDKYKDQIQMIIENSQFSGNQKEDLQQMFSYLADYHKSNFDKLNEEIEASLKKQTGEDFNIHNALLKQEEIEKSGMFEIPLIEKHENSIGRIFLNVPFESIREYDGNKTDITYKGKNYPVTLKLSKDYDYHQQCLYQLFRKNNKKYNPILLPYLKRLFDVVMNKDDIDNIISRTEKDEFIDDCRFNNDLKTIICNKIPAWNISKSKSSGSKCSELKSYTYGEKFRYKYSYNNVSDHFLIDNLNDTFISGVNDDGSFSVIVESSDLKDIYFFELKDQINPATYSFSNQKQQLCHKFNFNIKSRAGIDNLMSSFQVINDYKIRIEDIDCEPSQSFKSDFCYHPDKHLIEDYQYLRKNDCIIYFSAGKEDNFTGDLITFALSNIQLILPEFNCIGIRKK